MIPTMDIMNFLQHSSSFVWSEASQVRVDMKLGVRLLVQDVSEKSVSGGQVHELLCFCSDVEEGPILQISNNRIPPSWRGINEKDLSDQSLDARVGDMLNGNLPSELKLYGCPQVGKCVRVIVFRTGDPFEVASRDFRFQPEDQLLVLCHPSIPCDVFPADLVNY